jgi:peroxiredoxin
VLTVSSTGGSVSWAAVRLTAYALGLGIPFLLTALALDQAQGIFRRLQRHMRLIEAVSGAFLLLIGALVFSGELSRISRAGAQGGLADLSFNLEDCAVGVIQGRVRLENTRDCLSDGVKEKFYLAFDKSQPVAVVEVPTASDATFSAQSSPGPEPSGGGLVAPPLDGGLEVPDLAAPEDTTSAAVNAPVGLRVGQRAPDFTTRLLTGETVSLSDYRGKVVLLNFWATWCGPCRQEMPELQTIYETRGAEGFVVLAVNYREGPDAIAGFADEFGMTFPIALDQDGRVNEDLYGSAIAGYPTSFLIDQNGVIVSYFPRAVSGSELLAALDDLLG